MHGYCLGLDRFQPSRCAAAYALEILGYLEHSCERLCLSDALLHLLKRLGFASALAEFLDTASMFAFLLDAIHTSIELLKREVVLCTNVRSERVNKLPRRCGQVRFQRSKARF